MATLPIALQLYSVREDCQKDLPGVLEQVAAMGYDGVEFAGYYDHSPQDLRKLLDANGLKTAGTHTQIATLLGEELEKTVAFNQVLDNPFLIVPGLPEEYRNSADAWRRTADIFNGIAERLEAHGMVTGYHNHFHEFGETDGIIPWEVLFDNTVESVVMQADIGNALHGGADVLPYIEKYPGRSRTVHLKEYAAGYDKALIGEGDVDWARCFDLCETVGGTEWYIVEQESYAHSPMECVRKCIANLRQMGK